MRIVACLILVAFAMATAAADEAPVSVGGGGEERRANGSRNAYATMMYMGTPRDYEFYVAIRVLLRSLATLSPRTDRVLIASPDLPDAWRRSMIEDGVKVVTVQNLKNPYFLDGQNKRFKLTLNKLYAWNLVDYERVVMLDADNLFLRNTDELFQCGQFCAVFINPCYFHTGLFVLQPSEIVFKDMLHQLEMERPNPDGADQGFLINNFPELLDRPMFHPPANASSKLQGTYRLPLGYQMDASYYYLKLRWNVPCGPNSVITFPGALWLKPWYWWAWPVLPLGLQWHQQRLQTIGYESELPMMLILLVVYLGIALITRIAKPSLAKLCYNRRAEKGVTLFHVVLRIATIWSIFAAYGLPFIVIPQTVHPVLGWALYLLGSAALLSVVISAFLLPLLPALVPWIGILGALFVMAYPWYSNGVVRAMAVFGYAFCAAPFVWWSLVKMLGSFQGLLEREPLFQRQGECTQMSQFSKLF